MLNLNEVQFETRMRNPFDGGALLPESVTTRNSRYDFRERAVREIAGGGGLWWPVTVTCVVGTFAGESWTVERDAIHVSPDGLTVDGIGLRTTRIATVNGYPVSIWE